MNEGCSEVSGAQTCIPGTVHVIQTKAQVEGAAFHLRRGKGRVAGIFQIELRTIERLAEQSRLHTGTHGSTKEFEFRGILPLQTLVREQSDLVVHQLHTGTVIHLHAIERHVGSKEGSLRVAAEACQLQRIGGSHINDRLLTDGCRIVRWLQIEIMTEVGIVLRMSPNADHRQHHEYY